jgi:hypothetical protein
LKYIAGPARERARIDDVYFSEYPHNSPLDADVDSQKPVLRIRARLAKNWEDKAASVLGAGSWRAMHLTQPPCQALIDVDRFNFDGYVLREVGSNVSGSVGTVDQFLDAIAEKPLETWETI